MITLVLTYRNRDLRIAENCLNSLAQQSEKDFRVILVDYGSDPLFAMGIVNTVSKYDFVTLISCPTHEQLWSKCRSINIALRQTTTPYFLVGDIDLMFHPDFIKISLEHAAENVVYFQYGFLSEKESLQQKDFEAYKVDFLGSKEVTGTTLFPTNKLSEVHGYDEFYHGWGAEDTDIHIRLRNLGLKVDFYNKSVLVKHQWHPKEYRSKTSDKPFHSHLERVNNRYMLLTRSSCRTRVNLDGEWGYMPDNTVYNRLNNKADEQLMLEPINFEVSALFAQLKNYKGEIVSVTIIAADRKKKIIQNIKKVLKKKYLTMLPMETVNNLLLEEIIKNYRNIPYAYKFDRRNKVIKLTLVF